MVTRLGHVICKADVLLTIGFMAAWYPMLDCNLSNASKVSPLPAYSELNSTTDANFAAFHGARPKPNYWLPANVEQ